MDTNENATIHGHFEISTDNGKTWEILPNLVVTEGLNYLLACGLGAAAQKTTFYIALFGGNVTPLNTWTGANFTANSTEFTNYTEPTRVLWAEDAVSAGAIGNTTTEADFTMGVGGGTVRGAALVEASAKSSTSGILVAAKRFPSDKVLAAGEVLKVRYVISASSS
jgi:hypothetical protein